MAVARHGHTATLLTDGRVLVAGGCNPSCDSPTAEAELYDPASGTWSATGSMMTPRATATATRLPDGKVLVAGGRNGTAVSSAELYDPASGTWAPTGSMSTPRTSHLAALLTGGPLAGKVLVAGGSSLCDGCAPVLASAELYDPSGGILRSTGSMTVARLWDSQHGTVPSDGSLLGVGGVACCPTGYQWIKEAER
jgi:hypothetical protein